MKAEEYKELIKAYDELQRKYKEVREKYDLEKCLKNEAYSFIISTGGMSRFKNFQNDLLGRNETESVVSYLVDTLQPDGEWIAQ